MANEYTVADLLEFLTHASERGLMPAATATALAVASRKVFGVLGEAETVDLPKVDVDALIKRFNNKHAKEFSPASLKEYGRRTKRALELFLQWRDNPAEFSVKTRSTADRRRQQVTQGRDERASDGTGLERRPGVVGQGYQSAFPVRPGHVVVVSNIPEDLTAHEAERLAQFIKLLAVG